MTKPTVEQMIDWLGNRDATPLCSHGEEFNEAIKNREMLRAIRAHLAQQSGNALPLDEIPEGWRFDWLSYSHTLRPGYSAQISALGKCHLGSGPTPAAALRAAIERAKAGA